MSASVQTGAFSIFKSSCKKFGEVNFMKKWNCQEMYSQRTPKIFDRHISDNVMRECFEYLNATGRRIRA